jgi:HlyD family secretion protein
MVRKKLKKSIKIFLFFILIVISSGLLSRVMSGCRIEETGIETFTVSTGDITTTITSTGKVVSTDQKHYSLIQSAEVLQSLKKGDSFIKGDTLIRIDDSRAKLYSAQAEENLSLAEQAISVAKINYQSALDANHVAIQVSESSNQLAQTQTEYAFKALDNAASLGMASVDSAEQAIDNANYYLEEAKDSAFATDLIITQAETGVSSAEKALTQAQKSAKSQEDSAEGAYQQTLTNQSITYWNNINSLEMAAAQINLMQKSIRQAEIQLEIAKINLEVSELDLKNFYITAPFDGIVTEANFSEGEVGSPGVPAISIIKNEFVIKSDINETDISRLETGQQVEFTLDAYPDKTFNGTISEISPLSEDIAGIITFEITVKSDSQAEGYLRSGFSANLTIALSKTENVLFVPIQAVYEEGGKQYVDLLGNENQPVKTEVTTGNSDYDYIEIKSGLSEGDVIILSG